MLDHDSLLDDILNRTRLELPATLKDLPSSERVLNCLSKRLKTEFRVEKRPLPIIGGGKVEVAIDSEHTTMLFPSSVIAPTHLQNFDHASLDGFDEGTTESGLPIVTKSRTAVKRLYVDIFLDCLQSLQGVDGMSVRAYIGKATAPLLLLAPPLAFFIAPLQDVRLTVTGRYNPWSVYVEKHAGPIVVICEYCRTRSVGDNTKCSSCGAPLPLR